MIGNLKKTIRKKKVLSAFVLLSSLLVLNGTLFAKTADTDPALQKEINAYGADIDQTIIRQYIFIEDYAKQIIDSDIQSVPFRVNIIQPKRDYDKGKDIDNERFLTENGRIRFKDPNTIEIVQHGFIYDDEMSSPDPIGRKYKTIKLKFSGSKESRKLETITIEVYEKNYKNRTYFVIRIEDGKPVTDRKFAADSKDKVQYEPDANGHTQLDQSITIKRRSNGDDAEQIAKETALADQTMDRQTFIEKTMVEKKLSQVKNTPAQPLRNEFKNAFYRVHLAAFSNTIFHIYEMDRMRFKDSDNYMLDFLKESTTY